MNGGGGGGGGYTYYRLQRLGLGYDQNVIKVKAFKN